MDQLDEEDRQTVLNMIETMLTKNKFRTFFEQNIQTAK